MKWPESGITAGVWPLNVSVATLFFPTFFVTIHFFFVFYSSSSVFCWSDRSVRREWGTRGDRRWAKAKVRWLEDQPSLKLWHMTEEMPNMATSSQLTSKIRAQNERGRGREGEQERETGGGNGRQRDSQCYSFTDVFIFIVIPLDQFFSWFLFCALPLINSHVLLCFSIVYYMVFAFKVLLCSLVKILFESELRVVGSLRCFQRICSNVIGASMLLASM